MITVFRSPKDACRNFQSFKHHNRHFIEHSQGLQAEPACGTVAVEHEVSLLLELLQLPEPPSPLLKQPELSLIHI